MDKEEILKKARLENKNQDVFEQEAVIRAGSIATKVGLLLCCVVAALEVILTNSISFSSWTIYFGILSTAFFVKYRILHRKHELLVASVYLVFAITFLALYILQLVR